MLVYEETLESNQTLSTMNVQDILEQHDCDPTKISFELTLNSKKKLKYYPHLSWLSWTSNQMPLSLDRVGLKYKDSEGSLPVSAVSPSSPVGKSREIKKIKISMGLKCNYSCSYCLQTEFRKKESPIIQEQLSLFVEKIKKNIKSKEDEIKIELWGGEPLLYWDTVTYLVGRLTEIFPRAKFSLVTNATLLTQEKIDFIVKNKISIGISHDGHAYHLRGKDPLKNPHQLSLIKQLVSRLTDEKLVSFNCVLTENNYSLLEIYKYIYGYIEQDFYLSTEGFAGAFNSGAADLVKDLDRSAQTVWRNIFDDLTSTWNGRPFIERTSSCLADFWQFVDDLKVANSSMTIGQKCGMDRPTSLAVDLAGNVLTCQNVPMDDSHKIGNLESFSKISLNTATHWSHKSNCRGCPVLTMCGGSCMFLEGSDRIQSCNGRFIFYIGLLATALYYLTGEKLDRVGGQIRGTEKNYDLSF